MDGTDVRVAVLVSRFNAEITDALLEGATDALRMHGVESVDVLRVPGAWELPQTAARVVDGDQHDAVVALGCVIRGETPHFEYVAGEASRGLGQVALSSSVPVTFGLLTTDDPEQARARSGPGISNKGWEAAITALEMVALYRENRLHPGSS